MPIAVLQPKDWFALKMFTSPRAFRVHESPSSSFADLDFAEGAIFFDEPKTETAAASSVAADIENDVSAIDDNFRGCFVSFCFCPGTTAMPTGSSADLESAGRRRRRTGLAPGPAAGTRSSTSRWWMRSALTCVTHRCLQLDTQQGACSDLL